MANYKEKQLTYRRAVWLLDGPAPATLESLIRQTMAKLKTAAARQIQAGGGHVLSCVDYEPIGAKGIYLHLSSTTPGESASIVKVGNISTSDKIELGTYDPPQDTDYLDGDSFILIKEK
jgi:hypothetical protein